MKYLALKFKPISKKEKHSFYGLVIENYYDPEFGIKKQTNLILSRAVNSKNLGKSYGLYMLRGGKGDIKEPLSFSNPFDIFRETHSPRDFYETKELSEKEKKEFKEGLLEFLVNTNNNGAKS